MKIFLIIFGAVVSAAAGFCLRIAYEAFKDEEIISIRYYLKNLPSTTNAFGLFFSLFIGVVLLIGSILLLIAISQL